LRFFKLSVRTIFFDGEWFTLSSEPRVSSQYTSFVKPSSLKFPINVVYTKLFTGSTNPKIDDVISKRQIIIFIILSKRIPRLLAAWVSFSAL